MRRFITFLALIAAAAPLPARQAQTSESHAKLFSEMRWRNIGPLRAGRTKAVAGIASQPFTFYLGMVNGGVWKTTNAGRTWTPIFEDHLRRQWCGTAATPRPVDR
jgi:hypothetical protein